MKRPIFGGLSTECAKRNICVSPVGTEEMGHWEMLGAMIRQCMKGCTCQELTDAGLAGYYTMHDHGVFPADPNGVPFSSSMFAVTGDPIADIVEDMAADAAITQEQHCEKKPKYGNFFVALVFIPAIA